MHRGANRGGLPAPCDASAGCGAALVYSGLGQEGIMALLEANKIRNIAIVGHSGSGKTTLAEAMLHKAGVTNRMGSVADGTSILDYSDEAKEKQSSIDSALCNLRHKGLHVNVIDTPGTRAFCGPAIAALTAVETVVLVIDAASGIQVNTRKMFDMAKSYGLGVWIVINKIDAPNIDLAQLLSDVQESFGAECVPLNLPAGGGKSVTDCFANDSGDADFSDVAEAHTGVIEAIVGANDALMEKYLGGELSNDEALAIADQAVAAGEFIPVMFTSAGDGVGVAELMDAVEHFAPSPVRGFKRTMKDGDAETKLEPKPDDPFVAQVFKIVTDPKSHIKYICMRVFSGKLTSDMTVKTEAEPKGVRPGHVLRIMGAEHKDIDGGAAGDIIALAKLDFHIGDVVFSDTGGKIAMPKLPNPMFSLAIESKSHGDEDKITAALKRYSDEDPCFKLERGTGGELVVRGMGDAQVRSYLHRMSVAQKLEVDTKPPRIPYRETITGRSDNVEYTHKKQSGGSGEFGRVIINVYPSERGEGYEFIDKIFGGAIDQAYRPSVDKGVKSAMEHGVLAGYPVVDVKVELIDGKTHPVDSKDSAFQKAGREAFKKGFLAAKPCLLEPIVNVEVTVPADNVGDITGDLASRRGRPQGQDMIPGGMAVIKAVVPLGELSDYSSRLQSISGGQGSWSMEFSHYEPVPGNVQKDIVDKHQKELEAAHS